MQVVNNRAKHWNNTRPYRTSDVGTHGALETTCCPHLRFTIYNGLYCELYCMTSICAIKSYRAVCTQQNIKLQPLGGQESRFQAYIGLYYFTIEYKKPITTTIHKFLHKLNLIFEPTADKSRSRRRFFIFGED